MKKPLEHYMNDPDIAHYPMPLREIYAIRLQIYDETKGMTTEEYSAYVRRETKDIFDRIQAKKATESASAK